ncbi:hypothetical protein WJX81_005355 [Elliptochloris bilobata]|uniref:Uncharacterized protein n=1 Tax=Elliptochloris bilobata TaxID=381761 RepID=A0AAW1QDN7_9CHLO
MQPAPLSRAEVSDRITTVVNIVRTAHILSPYDKQDFNAALLVWKAIAGIPAVERPLLLKALLPKDICQLWKLASQRRKASAQQLREALGPDYSLWDDFPEHPGQVVVYQGLAALPLHFWFGRFKKSFFLHPNTFELYGRVGVEKGVLGDMLYSLYFKGAIAPTAVPATAEVADVALEYTPPERLGLTARDLPRGRGWAPPAPLRWPFGGGLTDYMRPIGPGVYVGSGWKEPQEGSHELGCRFLKFLLVRQA